MKTPNSHTTTQPEQSTGTSDRRPVIEVRMHVPHVPAFGRIAKRLRSTGRRTRIAVGITAIVAMGLLAYTNDLARDKSDTLRAASTTQNPLDRLQKGTPNYPTILPEGKSIEQLGGWTRVSPPERDPVFAYVDKIASVPISVSEQPLPASFKSNPDGKVRDIALAHGADKTLSVDGTKIYIGTSKNGPQSVIFATDRLLVLMKSSSIVPDEEWKNYIQSLG